MAKTRGASVWRGRTALALVAAQISGTRFAANWVMYKLLFASLTLTTACASSDKPVARGGSSAPASGSETIGNVAFVTSKDGTRIAFEKMGTGPALILVGGALSDRNGGKPLAGKLSERFTTYVYDRRGRGESGDTKPYAVEREIEDLEAVIQRAGGSAYLYGVSSGGALVLQAAAKLGPAKVTKLAVYEIPYGQEERVFEDQKDGVEQRIETGKPGDAAAFFLSAIGTPPQALEEMKRSPQWQSMAKTDFTLAYDYAVLGDGQVPESVKQIRVPTLVMIGEKSLPFMPAAADRLAKLIPNAQRQTLAGQSHQAAPDVVVPLLTEFFGEAREPGALAKETSARD